MLAWVFKSPREGTQSLTRFRKAYHVKFANGCDGCHREPLVLYNRQDFREARMAIIQWDPRLETGQPEIDDQHRKILENLRGLQAAMKAGKGKQELDDAFYFLKAYFSHHLAAEEALMASHRLAGMTRHKEDHQMLKIHLQDLSRKYGRGEADLALDLIHFLEDYFVEHIMTEDLKLAMALRGEES